MPRGLTHGLHRVLEPATRIVVPGEGRIVPRELQQRPARLALRPCIRSRGEEGDHNGRVRSDPSGIHEGRKAEGVVRVDVRTGPQERGEDRKRGVRPCRIDKGRAPEPVSGCESILCFAENGKVVKEAFVEVLRLGRQMGLVKVGMVSVDGTHIKANASKHKSVGYDRAGELEELLRKDVEELLQRAAKADAESAEDGQKLPQEIARREVLLEKMRWAREELEKRAKSEDGAQEPPEDPEGPKSGGESPVGQPKDSQQINLTDPDSALMRKSRRDSYEQAYNAQAVVDAEGSQLILATDVIATPSGANLLEVEWWSRSGPCRGCWQTGAM